MPRTSPSPSSQPQRSAPASVRMYGMTQNSAIGAMRNAVIGAEAASNVMAKPNTRPC